MKEVISSIHKPTIHSSKQALKICATSKWIWIKEQITIRIQTYLMKMLLWQQDLKISMGAKDAISNQKREP